MIWDWKEKQRDELKYSSYVEKPMSLKKSCHWWTTSPPNGEKLGSKTKQNNQLKKKIFQFWQR